MNRYKLNRRYESDRFAADEGDTVEMPADLAEHVERDSPGTLQPVDEKGKPVERHAAGPAEETVAAVGEAGAAVLTELRDQTPAIDLDPEDKAKEIPGEGNKRTPASGITPPEQGARVVEKAPNDRMKRGARKRGAEDETEQGVKDTSAQARVTDATPASEAADAAQVAGGTTAQGGGAGGDR